MTTLTHPAVHASATAYRQPGLSADLARYVRSSRSLASMLPAFLSSGVMTLLATGVMLLMWGSHGDAVLRVWMESWLTAWPIAFPVAYLLAPVLARVTALTKQAPLAGLGFGDIAEVSARVTEQNGIAVLRGLKPAHEFIA